MSTRISDRLFPTTIAGSLPKPAWLAEPERLWPQWYESGPELAVAKADATRVAILEQTRAGIDVVTDGEQSRRHFVHGFLERIDGVDFTKIQRRGIRADRYQADCPTIVGPIVRRTPVHVDEMRFARGLTDRGLKITLPGPMTIVDTLNDEHYRDRQAAALAFADALRAEIADLARAGVDVVQLDEPAFNVYFDEVAAWGVAAIDRALDGATVKTALHICYGYGIKANIDWKHELGEVWDQYGVILPLVAKSRVDQVSVELAGSHVPAATLAALRDKEVAVGVVDVANDAVETPQQVAATLELAANHVSPEKIWASTNCGMAPMNRDIAYAKLRAIGAGAALARARAGARR
ncbi:MAG: methionine synthase [Vulcanimicrobiaceae bacterium]